MLRKRQPVVKRLVKAIGADNYNVLQNNGRIAHQEVDHVCIPRLVAQDLMADAIQGAFPYGEFYAVNEEHLLIRIDTQTERGRGHVNWVATTED
jgi:hypothetical protein